MTETVRASFELIEKTKKGIKRTRIMSVSSITLHTLIFAYLFSLQFKFVFLYQDSPNFAVLNLSFISPLVLLLAVAITLQVIRTKRDWNGKPEHIAILSIKRRLEALEAQNKSTQTTRTSQMTQ